MIRTLIKRMRTPPTNGVRADESYFEKLLRYIPGDIVAGYVALNGIIVGEAGNSPILQWIVFGALLVLSPLYMCYMKTEPPGINLSKAFPCVVAALSFAVWVFALRRTICRSMADLIQACIWLCAADPNDAVHPCAGEDLLRYDSASLILSTESF